jgi:hypothetical protein
LFDRPIAEIKKAQPQPELAAGRPFHHVMAFQHHQEAVRGTFVKLERGGHLRQAKRGLALAEKVEDRERAIQSLNLVCALGRSISHSGPQFRKMIALTSLSTYEMDVKDRTGVALKEHKQSLHRGCSTANMVEGSVT